MQLPFTPDQFLSVFERMNVAIWPVQLVAYAAAGAAIAWLAWRPDRGASLAAGLVLAACWAFTGAVYFLGFFRDVSGIAVPAGVLFLVEAALVADATARGRLRLAPRPPSTPAVVPTAYARDERIGRASLGATLVVYATVVYPVLGAAAGHYFPRAPAFGVTPCPTVIFTFGLLLLAGDPVPRRLLPIPVLWSLFGLSAALQLGMYEDLGLPVAAATALAALPLRRRGAGQPRAPGARRRAVG